MNIRKFIKKDAERCSGIIYACLATAKKLSAKDRDFLRNYYTPKNLIKHSKEADLFVVEKSKKIIGMGKLNDNLIATVYFEPKFHRKGGGTLIIKRLEKLAKSRKIKKIYLYALLQAIKFYEKLGFKKIRKIKTPVESMKMEKILK